MLLAADLHLTDHPDDEYRFGVFARLREEATKRPGEDVWILGDLADRKDKHPARLVNRIQDELALLSSVLRDHAWVNIIKGNHDEPLVGGTFWRFLGHLPGVRFFDQPRPFPERGLLALPFSADPRRDWAHFRLREWRCILGHQPLHGAVTENGFKLDLPNAPLFPRGPKVYLGDQHVPQRVSGATYVGAPHPIDFGDDHPCRLLRLAPDYSIAEEIALDPPRKLKLAIRSIHEIGEDVFDGAARRGDRAKVVVELDPADLADWPAFRGRVEAWAEGAGVALASLSAQVTTRVGGVPGAAGGEGGAARLDPLETLTTWARGEGDFAGEGGEALFDAGRGFLREALGMLQAE